MRTAVMLKIGVLLLASTLAVGAQTAAVSLEKLGPQIGDRVPDFAGTDQRGRPQTLASVMGEQGAMLVFFRSADW